jgi:hypothetical protein
MVETWVHLLVVHHFRTSDDSDTADSGTQPAVAVAVAVVAAAAVQH